VFEGSAYSTAWLRECLSEISIGDFVEFDFRSNIDAKRTLSPFAVKYCLRRSDLGMWCMCCAKATSSSFGCSSGDFYDDKLALERPTDTSYLLEIAFIINSYCFSLNVKILLP